MEKESYIYHLPATFDGEDFKIGIVLSLDKDHNQFHCGLSFDMANGIHILHLKSHKKLFYNEDWSDFRCIVKPSIHPLRLDAMIPLCYLIRDKIGDEDSQVPYGFYYDEYASYDLGSGVLSLGCHESGLTCATFVMTLFHSIGIDLIDIENWTKRPEDDDWETRIKRLFSSYKDIFSRIHSTLLSDFKALILMSDGVSDAMFETDATRSGRYASRDTWRVTFAPAASETAYPASMPSSE